MLHELFDRQPPVQKMNPVSSEAGSSLFEDLGSFGLIRDERHRAIMLEIRHANGLIRAYNYSWLESAEFNPSEGISLNFSGTKLTLVGRNLNAEAKPNVRLFESLMRHRVVWVEQADESVARRSADSEVVIEEVKLG